MVNRHLISECHKASSQEWDIKQGLHMSWIFLIIVGKILENSTQWKMENNG